MNALEKKNVQMVKVYIRQRPFTKAEIELRAHNIIQKMTPKELIVKSGLTEKKYIFDEVFGDKASQEEIFNVVVKPLIENVTAGYNCTVFAYGQTGTGKTHTMIGECMNSNLDINTDCAAGMIPRAAAHLFSELGRLNPRMEYTVRVSCIEIYNEDVRDLLAGDGATLRVYEDPDNRGSVFMRGLSEPTVCNTREVYSWLQHGVAERQTAVTNLNRQSSRSHTLFSFIVHTRETTVDGEEVIKTGKLHLVDLAGSENIGRSGATDMRAREAGTINKSLLTLGKVIKALAQKLQHIPYRDSKLTRILQDSLGGKTKTCMIGTISPVQHSWDETVSTLDYAHEARSVANCPQVNINRKQGNIIKELRDEIGKLRLEVDAARTGSGFFISRENFEKLDTDVKQQKSVIEEYESRLRSLEEYQTRKEIEFGQINESFDKTKSYLEKITQELKEKELSLRQNEFILNYVNGRENELNDAAKALLDVCEVSTKHEGIFHSKYQNLFEKTLSNSDVTRAISSLATDNIHEVEQNLERFLAEQEVRFKAINSKAAEIILITEKVTEQQALNQASLTSFTNAVAQDPIPTNAVAAFKTHLENASAAVTTALDAQNEKTEAAIENITSTTITSLNQLVDDCSASVVVPLHEEKQLRDEFLKHNSSLLSGLERNHKEKKRIGRKQSDLAIDLRTMLACFMENVEGLVKCSAEMDAVEEEDEGKLTVAQSNVEGYIQTEKLGVVIENVERIKDMPNRILETELSAIEEIQSCVGESGVMVRDHLNNYFASAMDNHNMILRQTRENLQSYVKHNKSMVEKFLQDTFLTLSTIASVNSESSDLIKKQIESLLHLQKNCRNEVINFSGHTLETIKSFETKLESVVHAGDTPIRQTYEYPKKITQRLPNQTLLDQFNETETLETNEASAP